MIKHGMWGTSTYLSWFNMKARCLNKNHDSYKYYGSRGIKVCDRWLKFENFFEDMGVRPQGKSIDRIDNRKGYSLSNCKWSTKSEQMCNTRRNVVLSFNGDVLNIVQWARKIGMNTSTLRRRIGRGWSTKRAILTPAVKRRVSV